MSNNLHVGLWEALAGAVRDVENGAGDHIAELGSAFQPTAEIAECVAEFLVEHGLGARVLAVAEAYDVMKSKASYKKSISNAAAVSELKNCSGTQFDPAVVDALVKTIEKT